jgi:ATP-dependent Clp protease protease subunit
MKKYTNHSDDSCETQHGESFDFNNVLNKNAANNRVVYLWNELGEEDSLAIISQLSYLRSLNNDPIQIVINSPGGSVDAMYGIVDEVKALQAEGIIVSTLVAGSACSAAGVILAYGTKGYRFARPNSMVMLHPMSYSLGYDYSEYQEKLTQFLKKKSDKLNRDIAEALGIKGEKNFKKFISQVDKGLWLSAEEAVTIGAVDKIYTKPIQRLKGK